jgi:hypothetical protein
MKYFLILVLFSLAFICRAQYPFEKYPAIKYRAYEGWTLSNIDTNSINVSISSIIIPNFYGKENLKIKMLVNDQDTSYILLYKGEKLFQKIFADVPYKPKSIRVADINGDGLQDIKLVTPHMGSTGLASMNMDIIYLFQKPNGKFTFISYTDMVDMNRAERDIDGDGNYEIITMYLQDYETHNYWVFNLYNYKNGKLVNVNEKFDYPIMVQFLYRENYKPANFGKAIRKKYSLKEPGIKTDY